jgi:hypothetical protein
LGIVLPKRIARKKTAMVLLKTRRRNIFMWSPGCCEFSLFSYLSLRLTHSEWRGERLPRVRTLLGFRVSQIP